MRLLVCVLAAGAVLGTVAGVAVAQAPTAQQLHQQGRDRAKAWRTSQDRADLQGAIDLFKQALALGDDPQIECDLALMLHYLGEDARAHARFTRCMPRLAALSPDKVGGYRGIETAVNAAVGKDHGAVDVASTPPGAVISVSTFPADETVGAPTLLWLRAGSHTLTAHVDGHVDVSFTVEITAAEAAAHARKTWRVKLEPEVKPALAPEERRLEPELPRVMPAVEQPAPRRTAAYATLAVGGALLVGGGVVHLMGRDEREHLGTLRGQEYDDYLPTWQTYQRATIGLYAAGAVATGVGAWLYLRAKTPAPLAVSPAPEGRGAMLWVFSK